MREEDLPALLRARYGLENASLEFLREGGGRSYLVRGAEKYLLKVIGGAFADTARQSVSIQRFLEESGFPVPKTVLTGDGAPILEVAEDGETRLLVLQEFLEGEEPDLEEDAAAAGELTGRLHALLERCPVQPPLRGRAFFIGRYLDFLRQKACPALSAYEELGEALWKKVEGLPMGICHGDLHRGNLLKTRDGQLYLLDFDTLCRAPRMFDVAVLCDMTDYFRLTPAGISAARAVYRSFLSGYSRYQSLSREELLSFQAWVAIRHFQLQATIFELYGPDCVDERFPDAQLRWLRRWLAEPEESFL